MPFACTMDLNGAFYHMQGIIITSLYPGFILNVTSLPFINQKLVKA